MWNFNKICKVYRFSALHASGFVPLSASWHSFMLRTMRDRTSHHAYAACAMRLSRTAKVCYKFKQIENFKSVRLPLRVCGCAFLWLCACVCVRLFICLSTAGCCLTLTVPHFEATPNWFGICPWLIQAINAPVSLPTLSHTHTQTQKPSPALCVYFFNEKLLGISSRSVWLGQICLPRASWDGGEKKRNLFAPWHRLELEMSAWSDWYMCIS